MKTFRQYLTEYSITYNYDRNKFASLPWDWNLIQSVKIVNALYYYSKANYINGKPEPLTNYQFSLITLPNLKSIPNNQLSSKNLNSGKIVNPSQFAQFLKNPQTWYDDKIDQIYDGIKMLGKTPENFGGLDIRKGEK